MEKKSKIVKRRQIEAKRRRVVKAEVDGKNKVLHYFKWSLIKQARSHKMSEMQDELEVSRMARSWLIMLHFKKVMDRLRSQID